MDSTGASSSPARARLCRNLDTPASVPMSQDHPTALAEGLPSSERHGDSHERSLQRDVRSLLQQARALSRANQSLQDELDVIVHRLRAEVHPVECQLGRTLRTLCSTLLSFAESRSLRRWQRAALDDWIDETVDELNALGLVDDALHQRLARRQAAAIGLVLDPQAERSASEQLDAFVSAILAESPSEMAELYPAFEPASESTAERAVDENAAVEPATVGLFTRLFRRTARALHPDREPDAACRERKQSLMARLLAARREQDLVTVFDLYAGHVDAELSLGNPDYEQLKPALSCFLAREQNRRSEIINHSSLHRTAWQRFHGESSPVVERKLAEHVRDVQARSAELAAFTDNVDTLSALIPYLQDRHDRLVYPA